VKSLWFGPLVGLALLTTAAADEKKKAPLYTNEDLERLAPYRGQTGVLSKPAVEEAGSATAATQEQQGSTDEAYWRREAARVRERTKALRDRADDLRRELQQARDAARSEPWTSRARSPRPPSIAPREGRLATLEGQIRALELDLEERARRARALPGWLR
jgi:hypothetical protein